MKIRKLLFAPVMLIMLISCVFTAFGNESKEMIGEYEKFYRGDMNDDKNYSFKDALSILKVAAKIDEKNEKADMDLDGTVTIDDAKIMFDIAYNKTGTYGFYTYAEPDKENLILVDNMAYQNGDSVFHSLKDAIEYINNNAPNDESGRITVLLAPGVYREQVIVTAPYVTIKPMDKSAGEVKLTYFLGCGNYYYGYSAQISGSNGATFTVDKPAAGFEAYDIVFENSYNIYLIDEELELCIEKSYERIKQRFTANDATINQTQALAVRCAGDKAVFENCTFLGRQDTLMLPTGNKRSYFKECYIEGTVDFIYADGTAVFDHCIINSPYNSGYVTAASTPKEREYGFLFYECSLTREAKNGKNAPADNSYSLGRTWGQDAMVCFWNCRMDDHIRKNDERWQDMGDCKAEDARYFEVGSMDINGNPLDLESFVDKSTETLLTQEDMTGDGKYAAWKWLWGNDQWNPAGFEVPAN